MAAYALLCGPWGRGLRHQRLKLLRKGADCLRVITRRGHCWVWITAHAGYYATITCQQGSCDGKSTVRFSEVASYEFCAANTPETGGSPTGRTACFQPPHYNCGAECAPSNAAGALKEIRTYPRPKPLRKSRWTADNWAIFDSSNDMMNTATFS